MNTTVKGQWEASHGSNDCGNGNWGSTASDVIKGTTWKEAKYEAIVKINGFMRKPRSKYKF